MPPAQAAQQQPHKSPASPDRTQQPNAARLQQTRLPCRHQTPPQPGVPCLGSSLAQAQPGDESVLLATWRVDPGRRPLAVFGFAARRLHAPGDVAAGVHAANRPDRDRMATTGPPRTASRQSILANGCPVRAILGRPLGHARRQQCCAVRSSDCARRRAATGRVLAQHPPWIPEAARNSRGASTQPHALRYSPCCRGARPG